MPDPSEALEPLKALEPLPTISVGGIDLVEVDLALARPLPTSAIEGRRAYEARPARTVLLVHVRAEEADGWAECAVQPAPTYSGECTATARAVLVDHLLPLAAASLAKVGDALTLTPQLAQVRGNEQARAAVELAILDAQLRAADRSLAGWLGATETALPAGAALSSFVGRDDMLAEAQGAVAAGASRVRVKIGPGSGADPLREVREVIGPDILLQADANGSFSLEDPDHLAELDRIDELGLACLEQPLDPADMVGHTRLARRLDTPICLDEPLTSTGAIEAAVALGACEVVCLKPGRVGGWPAARRAYERCRELGVPVWVGGMLETGVGRAANLAIAALGGMALPPDHDPRGRFDPDLADPLAPVQGLVQVPTGPGTGAAPDLGVLATSTVTRMQAR